MGFKVKATWTLVGTVIGLVLGWIGCTRFYDVNGLRDKVSLAETSTSKAAATIEQKMRSMEQSFDELRKDLRELKQAAAKAGGTAPETPGDTTGK